MVQVVGTNVGVGRFPKSQPPRFLTQVYMAYKPYVAYMAYMTYMLYMARIGTQN